MPAEKQPWSWLKERWSSVGAGKRVGSALGGTESSLYSDSGRSMVWEEEAEGGEFGATGGERKLGLGLGPEGGRGQDADEEGGDNVAIRQPG